MDKWTLFRWRVRALAVADWLLGTRLVDRVVDRWQQHLEEAQSEIAALQARMHELEDSRRATLRHLCLSYLQLRQLQSPDGWLHFDSRHPSEEAAIEVTTRALVAPHWARWTVKQVEEQPDTYTYDLVPDWGALHQDALNRLDAFTASLLDWIAEQARQDGK
jgi:hypothetical protein